jgi:hypothetical protein
MLRRRGTDTGHGELPEEEEAGRHPTIRSPVAEMRSIEIGQRPGALRRVRTRPVLPVARRARYSDRG